MKASLEILLLVAISISVLTMPPVVLAQQNDAISAAQTKLVQCYDAARAAESAGANISQLMSRLNSACLLLSRAQLAYSNGDFGEAQNLALQIQDELASLVSDANSLQTSAAQTRTFSFLLNVVGSISGTFAVAIGSFAVWVLLNRKYGNNGSAKE